MSRTAILAAAVLCAAPALASDRALSPQGYGPVTIGMSPGEASQALGLRLQYNGEGMPDPACHHLAAPAGADKLRYMVQDGRIVRISLYEGPSAVATDKGIRLGDPASRIMDSYGEELEIEAHEYVKGEYFTSWDETAKRGIRYETMTDDPGPFIAPGAATVFRIHAGGEAIFLIEGCS